MSQFSTGPCLRPVLNCPGASLVPGVDTDRYKTGNPIYMPTLGFRSPVLHSPRRRPGALRRRSSSAPSTSPLLRAAPPQCRGSASAEDATPPLRGTHSSPRASPPRRRRRPPASRRPHPDPPRRRPPPPVQARLGAPDPPPLPAELARACLVVLAPGRLAAVVLVTVGPAAAPSSFAPLRLDIRAHRPATAPSSSTSASIRAAGRRHVVHIAGRKPWNQVTSAHPGADVTFFLFYRYFYKIVEKFRKNSIKT